MPLTLRTLKGSVKVDGKDAEDIGSDEFIHETRLIGETGMGEGRVLIENQDTLIPEVRTFKWGGECRVEVDMHARLLPKVPTGQTIHVWGEARFYEGDSEDTDELEDRRGFAFDVPRTPGGSPPITFPVPLKNPALIGADDWAQVNFALFNEREPEDI
ncbi:hypothetical protein GT043_41795 [Streptomyces sp. SID2131]|nr:hypothetical protein [Streptomyces sp. SID2131]